MKRVAMDLISEVAQELDAIENAACGFGHLVDCTIEIKDETYGTVIRVTWDADARRWFVESEES
jgi:hypothetical protein